MYLVLSGTMTLLGQGGYRAWNRDVRLRLLPVSGRAAAVSRILVGWIYIASVSVSYIAVTVLMGRVEFYSTAAPSAAVFVLHASALAVALVLSDTSALWGDEKGAIARVTILVLVYLPLIGGIFMKIYDVLVPALVRDTPLLLGVAGIGTLFAAISVYSHSRYEICIGSPSTSMRPSTIRARVSTESSVRYLLRTHWVSFCWAYLLTGCAHLVLFHLMRWMAAGKEWDFAAPNTGRRVIAFIFATAFAGTIIQTSIDGEEPSHRQLGLLPVRLGDLAVYRTIAMTAAWFPYVTFWALWSIFHSNLPLAFTFLSAAASMWICQSLFVHLLDRGLRSPSSRFDVFIDSWSPAVALLPMVFAFFATAIGQVKLLELSAVPVAVSTFGVAAILAVFTTSSFIRRGSYVA